jgi:3-deoxy-D-manno-octulosonic acid kinase
VTAGPAGFRRLRRGPVALVVDPAFEEAARALGLLEPGGTARLLAGARGPEGRGATRRLALPAGGDLLLRPVLHGGWLGPLLGAAHLSLRRPLAELAATAALRAAGAPVPRAVLAAGWRARGPVWHAAVATIFEPGAEDARSFLAAGPRREDVLAAAAAAGRAVRRFHDAGGRHADLHLGNLLLRRGAGGVEALVVDLDRARAGAPPSPARRMRELMRLWRSAVKRGLDGRIGPRGCAAFFAAYAGRDRAFRRALLAHLPRERLRLRLHALAWGKRAEGARAASRRRA